MVGGNRMIEKELLENPSPWMNDDAVAYYESIMRPSMRILEFGSGYSTIWLEKFDPTYLVSYEHKEEWGAALQPYLDLCEITCIKDYPMSLMNVWKPETFDLIIIDGINRLQCLYWVLEHNLLAEGGTIVYDDIHRKWQNEEYHDAWETLEDEGFDLRMLPPTDMEHRMNNLLETDRASLEITLFAHLKNC
jgi:predicted O-methyltransferase YrrM